MFSPRCSLRCWGPLLAVSFLLPLGTSYAQDSAADASCDLDGDGVLALACDPEGDCNDEDASVYPGAVEVPEDGVDQDCDGLDLVYVITPMLWPTLLNLTVLSFIGKMMMFDLVWIMTGGGPLWATETVSTYVYKRAFNWNTFDLGYPSAIATVWFGVVCAAVIVLNRIFKTRDRLEY